MTERMVFDGVGSMQVIHLRPGLDVNIADFQPRQTVKMNFKTTASRLRFTFMREAKGHMDWRVSTGTAVTKMMRSIERSSSVSFHPELEGSVCFPAGRRQSHFSIQISQSVLNTLLGGRFRRVPHELQAICDGCDTIDFHHSGILSPVMEAAIRQLVNCPYSGQLGLIYQESKAIELIAHKLAQIESFPNASAALRKLRLDDIERVRHARDILINNLENPPRLFDLARAVGTSHVRLNSGFRKMYGTSVFGYLRRLRLEKARNFLEKGSMNVTEAALAVGYNSMSSFSRAFSTHFGSTPMGFIKRDRGCEEKTSVF